MKVRDAKKLILHKEKIVFFGGPQVSPVANIRFLTRPIDWSERFWLIRVRLLSGGEVCGGRGGLFEGVCLELTSSYPQVRGTERVRTVVSDTRSGGSGRIWR